MEAGGVQFTARRSPRGQQAEKPGHGEVKKGAPERARWGLLVRTPSIGGAENAA